VKLVPGDTETGDRVWRREGARDGLEVEETVGEAVDDGTTVGDDDVGRKERVDGARLGRLEDAELLGTLDGAREIPEAEAEGGLE